MKNWTQAKDKVLQILSTTIIERKLLKIKSVNKMDIQEKLKAIKKKAIKKLNIKKIDADYVVFPISIKNETYNFIEDEIKFLKKNNSLINLSEIKKEFTINTRNSSIIKHYICYPEGCD